MGEARRFFAEPVETKRQVAINLRHRGFSAIGDAERPGIVDAATTSIRLSRPPGRAILRDLSPRGRDAAERRMRRHRSQAPAVATGTHASSIRQAT